MLIDCVYRQGDMYRAVNESINTVSETRGWGCASDNHCGWIMPGATGKDRYRLLIGFYKSFKNCKPDDVLYSSQLAGHDSFDEKLHMILKDLIIEIGQKQFYINISKKSRLQSLNELKVRD